MLALLSGRFRRLLFFMIAVPISGRVLEMVGRRIEGRRGPTRLSRALRAGGSTAGRFSRGPLRPRAAAAARAAEQQYAAAPGSGVNGHGAAANEGHGRQGHGRQGRGRKGRARR